MKKLLLSFITICAGFSTSPAKNQQAHYASGYWVIEENIHQDSVQIVKYYSAEHELINEETVSGKKLNIRSRGAVKKLNRSLENILEKSENDLNDSFSVKNISSNIKS